MASQEDIQLFIPHSNSNTFLKPSSFIIESAWLLLFPLLQ